MLQKNIQKIDKKTILEYLEATGQKQAELFSLSKKIKEATFKNKVHFRGIIEFSNLCQNNCFYCGIRKGNKKTHRYKMSLSEIEQTLDFIDQSDYGSVVFQSGEIQTKVWRDYLLKIVTLTKKKYPKMGITISCGEQDHEFYKKLRQAGADRYLLRIETSNPALYKKLHPKNMSWDNRYKCLQSLKKLDYQVGTGIMVGLPGQKLDDLVDDLIFFKDNKFDMYGLGPYVVHDNTPLVTPSVKKAWKKNKEQIFNRTLNFLAIMRIMFPKANIAAATALDVFNPLGRIKVLEISANIIMPVVTPTKRRKDYLLYEGKPCISEGADDCYDCLTSKIKNWGLEPVFGEQGNSPFYYQKKHGQTKRI